MKQLFKGTVKGALLGLIACSMFVCSVAEARDLKYKDEEISVYVAPGEPTQIKFPSTIAGGFRKKLSSLSLDRKDADLILFANEGISDTGEAIIVRLKDGRSYSIRVKRASDDNPRDDVLRISDSRSGIMDTDEEDPEYKRKAFGRANSATVSGLMREMILASEFGKEQITGYQVSNSYQGETVLNDGTMVATIDRIFIGANLWGYVIDAQNLMDQTQRLNPATFRLHGTRAVSAKNWELAPRPYTAEQQISGKDKTKIYVITRARKSH